MVSGAAPGVVVMTVFNIWEVVGHVLRYQGGVVNFVDEAQCKLVYSVLNPEPAHFGEVGRGEVGSGVEV